jgi:hypothetical protein
MGVYKSELIHPYGPWEGVEHVEAATLDWTTGSTPSGPTNRSRT